MYNKLFTSLDLIFRTKGTEKAQNIYVYDNRALMHTLFGNVFIFKQNDSLCVVIHYPFVSTVSYIIGTEEILNKEFESLGIKVE